MRTWKHVRAELIKDPAFAKEVKKLEPEYALKSQIIKARIEKKMSQAELARKIGTRQSNISRLEKGTYNPSLQFLQKIAHGLGKELRISLK